MAAVITGKRMTYEDYLKINDNKRYEVLNGELHSVPAPSTGHRGVSRNLGFLIWNFANPNEKEW